MAIPKQKINVSPQFSALPDPSLRYGLQIFVNPKVVRCPWHTSWTEGEWRSENISIQESHDRRVRTTSEKISAWLDETCHTARVIRIPKNFRATQPVKIIFSGGNTATCGRLLVIAEEGSDCDVIFTDATQSSDCAFSIDITLQKNAAVRWHTTFSQQHVAQRFVSTSVDVAHGGQFERYAMNRGATYGFDRTEIILAGTGAAATCYSAQVGSKDDCIDNATTIVHRANATTSLLRSYDVLAGHARAIVRHRTIIDEQATKASAHQQERALLLNERTEIDTQPHLEIMTNDVVSGHSASVTRLDAEKIFYLTSRGLSEHDARQMIVTGFFAPVSEKIARVGAISLDEISILVASICKI